MKTVRITRVFDAAKLHGELEAAGVAVVTVRASSVEMGGPSSYGVVVLGEKADMKKAEGVIKAHKEDRKPSRPPDAKAMEAALRVMEKV